MSSWKYIPDPYIDSPSDCCDDYIYDDDYIYCDDHDYCDDYNPSPIDQHYYTPDPSYDCSWKPFHDHRVNTDSYCMPYPRPCPTPCPPGLGPVGPAGPAGIVATSQHVEAYTLGTNTANTLTSTLLSTDLSFVTAGESQGTDITYAPATPQTITLNAPGRYLILVKGLLNFGQTNSSPGTLTTSIVQGVTNVDQISHNLSLNSRTQDTFSLEAIVCNTTLASTISVHATVTGLQPNESIGYNDIRIIVIKLSDQACG